MSDILHDLETAWDEFATGAEFAGDTRYPGFRLMDYPGFEQLYNVVMRVFDVKDRMRQLTDDGWTILAMNDRDDHSWAVDISKGGQLGDPHFTAFTPSLLDAIQAAAEGMTD